VNSWLGALGAATHLAAVQRCSAFGDRPGLSARPVARPRSFGKLRFGFMLRHRCREGPISRQTALGRHKRPSGRAGRCQHATKLAGRWRLPPWPGERSECSANPGGLLETEHSVPGRSQAASARIVLSRSGPCSQRPIAAGREMRRWRLGCFPGRRQRPHGQLSSRAR